MTEAQTPRSALLNNVDNNFEKGIGRMYKSLKIDAIYYVNIVVVVFFLAVFIVSALLLAFVAMGLPAVLNQPVSTQIAIYISVTAAFIGLSSFGLNMQNFAKPVDFNKMRFEYNYKVMQKGVADENLAYLKGLVQLKSKHPDLSLKQFINPDISDKELFEILYKSAS